MKQEAGSGVWHSVLRFLGLVGSDERARSHTQEATSFAFAVMILFSGSAWIVAGLRGGDTGPWLTMLLVGAAANAGAQLVLRVRR